MKCTKLSAMVVTGLVLSTAAIETAAAQWGVGSYGVAEVDTKHTLLLLAGLQAGPGGKGVHPRVGVQAYYLTYEAGTAKTNVTSVKPWIGLVSVYDGGSLSGSVGYAWANKANNVIGVVPAAQETGTGVVLSGGWETAGVSRYALQALASYNLGSEGLWTRGRATTKIREGGSTSLGAEVAYLHGKNYWILQPGGVWQWQSSSGQSLGLGAGVKLFEGGGNAVYFKVEGGLPLYP